MTIRRKKRAVRRSAVAARKRPAVRCARAARAV